MGACGIATVVMVGYGLLAANVGTRTGQAHSILARSVLGRSGSGLASVLLVVTGMGWYGFQAVFLAQLLQGLFGLTHLQLFCAVFAIVMVTNNLLGFRSVSAYARFIAAPILLIMGHLRRHQGVLLGRRAPSVLRPPRQCHPGAVLYGRTTGRRGHVRQRT